MTDKEKKEEEKAEEKTEKKEQKEEKKEPIYKRIIFKVSGEAFKNQNTYAPFNQHAMKRLAKEIADIHETGIEIGVVIGGGNIVRGRDFGIFKDIGSPDTADEGGMEATKINALYLQPILENIGVEVRMQTAIPDEFIPFPYQHGKTLTYLRKKYVVIFSAGIGVANHTTDFAAAMRAMQTGADAILKCSNFAGVYKKFPPGEKDKPKPKLTYSQTLKIDTEKIFDGEAIRLLLKKEVKIPIHIFNYFENTGVSKEKRNLWRILHGEKIGTIIVP